MNIEYPIGWFILLFIIAPIWSYIISSMISAGWWTAKFRVVKRITSEGEKENG